jgi:hypothetical protein
MADPGSFVLEVKCYMVEKIIKSILTPNKWHLYLMAAQEVMIILVEGIHAVTQLCGIKNKSPQFLHKCNLEGFLLL